MGFTAGQRVLASQLMQIGYCPATPIATSSNGTATSGTTETQDIVLGNYVFTSSSAGSTRYQVTMNGLVGSGTVGDVYDIKIRDGGASAPTTSSTLVAFAQWECPATGGPGQNSIVLGGDFLASAGTVHTLGFFAVRVSGTGSFTPTSAALARDLFVTAIGTN